MLPLNKSYDETVSPLTDMHFKADAAIEPSGHSLPLVLSSSDLDSEEAILTTLNKKIDCACKNNQDIRRQV